MKPGTFLGIAQITRLQVEAEAMAEEVARNATNVERSVTSLVTAPTAQQLVEEADGAEVAARVGAAEEEGMGTRPAIPVVALAICRATVSKAPSVTTAMA